MEDLNSRSKHVPLLKKIENLEEELNFVLRAQITAKYKYKIYCLLEEIKEDLINITKDMNKIKKIIYKDKHEF